jgi:hypothetical protein
VRGWLAHVRSARLLQRRRHLLFKDLATKLDRARIIHVEADTQVSDDASSNYVAVLGASPP